MRVVFRQGRLLRGSRTGHGYFQHLVPNHDQRPPGEQNRRHRPRRGSGIAAAVSSGLDPVEGLPSCHPAPGNVRELHDLGHPAHDAARGVQRVHVPVLRGAGCLGSRSALHGDPASVALPHRHV